jgi:NDP-sugar pyrophosphorylase family protein
MKALLLAGGRGKRLNEISRALNKCMIKIKGKYVIEYNMDYAANTNVDEIIIVVGYKAEQIINYYGNRYKDKLVKYVIQWDQKGLVNAIECARIAIDGDDFMLLLGDELLINPRFKSMLDEFRRGDAFAICGVLRVNDKSYIKRTYTLIQDDNNIISRLIEKPRNPFNYYMGTGACVFRNDIFNYIEVTPIHHERNEKELPDLIQCAIDDGNTAKSFIICDNYININSEDDIKIANSCFI